MGQQWPRKPSLLFRRFRLEVRLRPCRPGSRLAASPSGQDRPLAVSAVPPVWLPGRLLSASRDAGLDCRALLGHLIDVYELLPYKLRARIVLRRYWVLDEKSE